MNFTQINYFLTAGRTLNFTDAAKELYISQPALSKQIVAMENELNMMLFIRDNKKVRLTPAGAVLLTELPKVNKLYADVIHKAKVANEGRSGELSIGILEGQMLGKKLTQLLGEFSLKYPNISLRLSRDSFSGLRRQLENETIDLAITLDFDLIGSNRFLSESIEVCPAIAVVSKNHPLAKKQPKDWKELKGETFIVVDVADCYISAQMVIDDCKRAGFRPILKYAPSLETAMLWIEAGIGLGFINTLNTLTQNPDITLLKNLPTKDTTSVIAWKRENNNPAISLFVNEINP